MMSHPSLHHVSASPVPVVIQFPFAFQFNTLLLSDLIDYVHCCRFGTFLFNHHSARDRGRLAERSPSVWSFVLEAETRAYYTNTEYQPQRYATTEAPIAPNTNIEALTLFLPYYVRERSADGARRATCYVVSCMSCRGITSQKTCNKRCACQVCHVC